MRQQWAEVPKDDVRGQWAALYVTMNPKGRIAMSRVTYERLGAPKAFNVLFDAANNVIGLKPTALTARGRHGARLIRAFRLCQECGIRLNETVRFTDPQIDEDGILNLDLRRVRPVKKGVPNIKSKS